MLEQNLRWPADDSAVYKLYLCAAGQSDLFIGPRLNACSKFVTTR